ncbi:hypothetical protein M0G43_12725 [Subsaxibacter sp. CAU 1640]|nr:hypothetical protein [Subsaxibacter sp. CAU 1640]MCK7591443.1 hypothetical protein [Subsaxibacter sp. CAU 1640]
MSAGVVDVCSVKIAYPVFGMNAPDALVCCDKAYPVEIAVEDVQFVV